jgi:citronellol/citronellal dehydrogenase
MKLSGKIAIVTGASRGLGKAMAIELARAGASVVAAARTVRPEQTTLPGTIFETVNEIEKLGGKAIAVQCDIREEEDVAHLVKEVNGRYGPVDILINNAGITTTESFLKLPTKKWDLVIAVNLRGTFLCTKAVLPEMVERQSGNIINLSSVLSKRIEYSIVYGTTKAAIDRFTLGLAKEMKRHNIAVNALCPDFTVTEAVRAYLPNIDTTDWQLPEMWGKYSVLVAAKTAEELTGRILDQTALIELFGRI